MNPFKQTIWKDFWNKQKDQIKEPDEFLELLVKEAVGKIPTQKINVSDKLKIKKLDLEFIPGGTLVQLNDCTNIIDIGSIKNMTYFVTLQNLEFISITYRNPKDTIKSNNELELESVLKKTNLFQSFSKLQTVRLIEICKNEKRSVNVDRKDITLF